MEMRAAASELHVAQQSRRDKLRVQYQQSSSAAAAASSSSLLNHFDHQISSAAAPASLLNHFDPQIVTTSAVYPNHLPPEEILSFSSPNSNPLAADPRWKLLGPPPQQVSYPASTIPYLSAYSSNDGGYDHQQPNHNQLQQSLLHINPDLTPKHYGEMQLDSPPQHQQLYQNSTFNGTNNNAADTAVWMDQSSVKSEGFRNHPHGGALALSLSSNPWGTTREIQGSTHQNAAAGAGPLGPFTGYATILKSSKFLRPAQNLLDEFCALIGSTNNKLLMLGGPSDDDDGRNYSGDHEVSADDKTGSENIGGVKSAVNRNSSNNNGGGGSSSSSLFYGSDQMCGEGAAARVGSSSSESCLPDYQHKKATLLYMQEEVCRRYRQYHQQMQMVVSSFESVAGLSTATPYISLALKTISRHFRCLKNAISNQLRHVRKALGEDISSPSTGTGSTKGDANTPRLKYMEQKFQKHKPGGVDAGFLEPQQHIWRPQRGLPERSVAILRAWLFDHFLHPYPTDTDKHMLATQTGLSRNQVSNWFINARVRVWKPMVEEIHMLETKGFPPEPGVSSAKNDGKFVAKHASQATNDQSPNPAAMMPDKRLESCAMGSAEGAGDGPNIDQYWNQEKRARVECQIPTSMGGALIGFGAYDQGGGSVGGMGAVSLTLGLRNNEGESSQQHLQQQEHRLRQHFGGHMIHDFVG